MADDGLAQLLVMTTPLCGCTYTFRPTTESTIRDMIEHIIATEKPHDPDKLRRSAVTTGKERCCPGACVLPGTFYEVRLYDSE